MISSRKIRMDLMRYYRMPSVQVSLGVVLAFLITSFFIMFAIRPTFATIVSLQKSVEDSKKLLLELEAKADALVKASTLLEKISPQLPTLESSIPNDGVGYDEISHNLEALAQNTNTTLETFTIGESLIQSRLMTAYKPSKKQEVTETKILIRARGDYGSLYAFLSRLAGSVRLTDIESITILKDIAGGVVDENNSEPLTMTINGSIYYMAEPGAIEKLFPSKGDK